MEERRLLGGRASRATSRDDDARRERPHVTIDESCGDEPCACGDRMGGWVHTRQNLPKLRAIQRPTRLVMSGRFRGSAVIDLGTRVYLTSS